MDRTSCEKRVNRKPSKKTEFDTEGETKGGKYRRRHEINSGGQRKGSFSLWIGKNIEKNNPPFNRKRS